MPTLPVPPTRLPRRIVRTPRSTARSTAFPEETRSPEQVMGEVGQSLRAIQAEVSLLQERCQNLVDTLTTGHRDGLHLRARVQGIEQCTRDAEQALARLRSRLSQ